MRTAPLILCAAAAAASNAQALVNNGAAITMLAGAQVSAKGDVLITAGGTISNTGTIDLSGDWTNNSGYDCFGNSEGTVILNGAGQQIGGASHTMFNHLTLAGGEVTLQQDAFAGGGAMTTESGVLDLGGAKLILNSRLMGITNAEPWAIMRTTGFMVSETGPVPGYGVVRWNIADHAPDVYIVPFGSNVSGDYLPLQVNLAASGSGAAGWFSFATYPTDPFALPNNRPLPTGMTSFTDLGGSENAHNVVDRFWITGTQDYLTEPWLRFVFTYRESEWNTGTNTIVEGLLQAQRWDGIWSNPPIGAVNTLANTVTTSTINTVPQVWALVQGSTPLPVELLSFGGERINEREVLLHWTTATEHDNVGFEVWRMIEGEADFTEVGWVDGAGDAQQRTDYAFTDTNDAERTSYYKLKQVDNDGQSEWSNAVAVDGMNRGSQMVLYPNPARDHISLRGLPAAAAGIALHDAAGRAVKQWPSTNFLDGLGGLERGVYTLSVRSTDGGVSSLRVVLE